MFLDGRITVAGFNSRSACASHYTFTEFLQPLPVQNLEKATIATEIKKINLKKQ